MAHCPARGFRPSPTRLPLEIPIATSDYSPRRLAYMALFVGAALTGAYAETIPNFEVLTLASFLAGLLLGARDGALVGGSCMLLYSLLNPYGPAHPLVTASQVAGQVLAGLAGGMVRRAGLERRPRWIQIATMGICGAALTVAYDLLTNLATGVVYGQLRFWLLAGIPFALWHLLTNLALFAAVGAPLLAVLARYSARLS